MTAVEQAPAGTIEEMGTYHVVKEGKTRRCPHCGEQVTRRVQFHFGDTVYMDEYGLGDAVRLRASEDSSGHLAVGGWPEGCPSCKADFIDGEEIVAVEIIDGRVHGTRPATEDERGRFL